MILSDYIKQVGVDAAARRLDAQKRTVMSWMYGYRFPRKEKAREIEIATDKLVTFAECYVNPKAAQ